MSHAHQQVGVTSSSGPKRARESSATSVEKAEGAFLTSGLPFCEENTCASRAGDRYVEHIDKGRTHDEELIGANHEELDWFHNPQW